MRGRSGRRVFRGSVEDAGRTTPIRLGAVDYLNARPLVYGLELRTDLFTIRFDRPSRCAALLHEGSIDVGMIPSIELHRGGLYHVVPDLAIVSDGPVGSVALFSTKPVGQVRTVAADTSSRSSNALLRVLCLEAFGIDPRFEPMPPDISAMVARCDAALLIGDEALFLDHEALGLLKVDLGAEWTALTGLPFVWAFWAGRPGAMSAAALEALASARDAGVRDSDRIAEAYCGPGRAARARAYLRENIGYVLGERERAGLQRYYELAAAHELVEGLQPLVFYPAEGPREGVDLPRA